MFNYEEQIKKNIPDLESYVSLGIEIENPICTVIEKGTKIGSGTKILSGSRILASTSIGKDCIVGPNTSISSSKIADGVKIVESIVTESIIEDGANIGPYTHIRPNSTIKKNAKVGSFAEVKNSTIGEKSKIPHLSYIGDATIGDRVNIGCGVVFANYDGVNKFKSVVEDDVFVGCNSNIIAPVTLKRGAYIAGGSTITKDVDSLELSIERSKQQNIKDWVIKYGPTKDKFNV